jgi:acetyl esterase/lipase
MRNISRLAALVSVTSLISACSPITVIDALTPKSTYEASNNLSYGSDPRQKLNVFLPNTSDFAVPAKGYPVVVFFYGGSWNFGSKEEYRFVGEALASKGLITVIADYRLYPQVRYPEFLDDCALAMGWVQQHLSDYHGNPARLYVMGHSAGAYNAAMLALDERWLKKQGLSTHIFKGWIGLAGPYDFLPIENEDVKPVFFHPNYPQDSQPIDFVSATAPRTFLGVSRSDDLVDPTRNTKKLAEKLSRLGVHVTLREYSSTSHATIMGAFARPLRFIAPVLDDVVAFVGRD